MYGLSEISLGQIEQCCRDQNHCNDKTCFIKDGMRLRNIKKTSFQSLDYRLTSRKKLDIWGRHFFKLLKKMLEQYNGDCNKIKMPDPTSY